MNGKDGPLRRTRKPAKRRVDAKAAVSRKQVKNDDSRVRDLEKRLAEALEEKAEALKREADALDQQTATSEILRVISTSPTDLQPVFETIAENALRLCDAAVSGVLRFDGTLVHLAAYRNFSPTMRAIVPQDYPMAPTRRRLSGRAILDRTVVHVPDVLSDPDYPQEVARSTGWRSFLSVPMLREGQAIGAVTVVRTQPGPFSDRQIELLKTFADQAVIAIENVRLFNETKEALQQQTATSQILQTMSSSPSELGPVFNAIAASATRLCDGAFSAVFRLDDDVVHLSAHDNFRAAALAAFQRAYPLRLSSDNPLGRCMVERRAVHITDLEETSDFSDPAKQRGKAIGYRALIAVPMLQDDRAIGAIGVGRETPGPFTDKQIALLKTFADQAVIAIENVRLFKELEARNSDLTEALERQTATSEILRVISSSPTDIQPVLDAIAGSAARLCEANDAELYRVDGPVYRRVAHRGPVPIAGPLGETYPISRGRPSSRAVLDRQTIHVLDQAAEVDTEYADLKAWPEVAGVRTVLATPLLREGVAVGVIVIRRTEVRPFSDKHIELLQTFADQAVIAIENVRLFKELEARNSELRVALEQQTATSDVLKVISRSTFDLMPVLETLTESATTLCGAQHGHIFQFDGEVLRYAVGYGTSPALKDYFSQHPVPLGPGSVSGTAAAERRTVHVHDVLVETGYQFGEAAKLEGWRTVLAVPMLRGDALLGVITIWKTSVEPFTEKQIDLVTSFADQAVIAIENVRLLKELQARTGELARSVEELKALGEVSQAVSSTLNLDNVLTTIVARAVELAGAHGGVIYEYDDTAQELHVVRAAHRLDEDVAEVIRSAPLRLGEGVAGRAAALGLPVQVADVLDEQTYDVDRIRTLFERHGYRAALGVPLLFERRILGVLTIWRQEAGAFTPEVVNLLQTFANQSVLAVENARLFREIEDKSHQLEIASQHKSEFLANMSHELRTPLNAIIGFSEVLTERMFGELNEKQDEYLKDIHASGQHLLSLINDILDLSKIEAGRMELEVKDFDVLQAIGNAVTLVRERAGRRGIALHQAVDQRLGQIRGDERKIKQVLLNLLSNALKFTPEGGRVDVRATVVDGMAAVSVTDTGVGIAPEDQEAVFEEFRQVGTADKKVEGTGLGLTLSRKFIELHGGRIWLQSEVGRGSTFTFTLPFSKAD